MARAIPQVAIDFVKAHEGRPPSVYPDVGGLATGGWGHLLSAQELIQYPVGTPISDTVADSWLASDLNDAAQKLYQKIKSDVIDALTENQWSALLDFSFNEGVPGTTLWQRLNARQFDQVPAALTMFVYVHVNGQPVKVQGLVNRRADEVKLWSTQEPGSVDAAPSSAVTRNVSTPAAPADPKPRGGIGPAIATAATAAAAAAPQAGQAVKAASDAIAPYTELNHRVAALASVLALVAAGLAILTLILVWLRNQAVSKWEPTMMPHLPVGSLPTPVASPSQTLP